MPKLKKITILAFGIVLIFVLGALNTTRFTETNTKKLESHKLIYFEEKLFYDGIAQTRSKPSELPKNSWGGIIPHHLLPSFMLSDFFQRLREHPPKTIILFGPNHKEAGTYKVLSSEYAWQTPFGLVEPKLDLIKSLKQSGLVHINEAVLEDEHSVAGMMPYIKYYLPQTQVVPLILRATLKAEEVDQLAEELFKLTDQDTFILAPIDFSHYLDAQSAAANDLMTYKAMKEFDFERIYKFNNDYTDSPNSVALILKLMQKLNATNINLFSNTNSGFLENKPFQQTTSYFSLMFN